MILSMARRHQIIGILLASCLLIKCNASEDNNEIEDVHFYSHEAMLSGSIVFPDKNPIYAAIVFVHGSGRMSRDLTLAKKFATEGIAALVYDKRGVARSEGIFNDGYVAEKELKLLADDAVSAINLLSKHKRLKNIRIGIAGVSQAGWIVPIAAVKSSSVSFIALWSGPVCKLSEEDIYSQYTSDRDFTNVPGFEEVLKMRKKPYQWSAKFGKDIDPVESLRLLHTPGLWIFGLNDGSIPVDLSVLRLQQLNSDGWNNYQYALFSGLGHSLVDQTFATMVGWIKNNRNSRFTPLNSDDLDEYVGNYKCLDPSIEITISKQNKKLIAKSKAQTVELEHIGSHSFLYNDYGSGYTFLDFDPQRARFMATQQGKTYKFEKVIK
jgi:pimeloyl-ACP methyl ester carboxylesterase